MCCYSVRDCESTLAPCSRCTSCLSTNRPALSGGMDWWRMEWPFSRVRTNIFQRPNFPGKSLKFRRKSDFCQISGSEIWKFRARKIAIPYPQPFHTPIRLPPNKITCSNTSVAISARQQVASSIRGYDVSPEALLVAELVIRLLQWEIAILGKSKWGLSNGGFKATLCNLHTIVHICALLWPFGPLSKGNFCHKMTTMVGNRGQLRTSTLSPHLQSPHLDFPDHRLLTGLSKRYIW